MQLVEQGKVDVKRQVTHRFPLAEIKKAFEVMKEGVALRSIVIP
jgi:Zn-dependent alcohol dehydrogenase